MIVASFDFIFTKSIDSRGVVFLLVGHLVAAAKASGAPSSLRSNSLTATATVVSA